jgi:alcohol dehydrogenase
LLVIQDIIIQWPQVIEFGAGRLRCIKEHLDGIGRVFIIGDPNAGPFIDSAASELKKNGATVEISRAVVPEPPIDTLKELIQPVADFKPGAVVGIGGGSTMDLAKLLSVLHTREQKVEDILGIGNVKSRKVKLITVSTTSGTGSEVTPIAILTDTEAKLKKGVVSSFLIPDVAVVDPELTINVPPGVTASTGMDAMTHCIEAFTNIHAHPIVDNIAIEGIRLIAANIKKVVVDGADMEARTAMALGSLYGGMCLGPVNAAAVHALAYPLGGGFKVPHGVANSLLLPYVTRFNIPACREKYARVARALGVEDHTDPEKMADYAVDKIRDISHACGIPATLKELDIPESAVPEMAKAAMQVTRLLDNNPRKVEEADAVSIYNSAWHGD